MKMSKMKSKMSVLKINFLKNIFPRLFYGFLILPAAFSLASCSKKTDFVLNIPDFYASPLSQSSRQTGDGKIFCYDFSKAQSLAFSNFFDRNKDAALFVQLRGVKADENDFFDLGFVYDEDSDAKNLSKRPVVSSKFYRKTDENGKSNFSSFALVFCVNKSQKLPAGFFIKSNSKNSSFKIESAGIIRACIGHDFSSENPVFAFGPNGGFNNGTDDFSGGSLVFSSVNTNESVMPVFKIKFGEETVLESQDSSFKSSGLKDSESLASKSQITNSVSESKRIAFGGENLSFRSNGGEIKVPAASLKAPFSLAAFPDGEIPEVLMMIAGEKELLSFSSSSRNPLVPIKVDPGLIMGWPRNSWRGNDYELFEWDRFPGILIMDISTYAVQDDFLRRIAFFVEKAGYKGRLLTDDFLKDKHGYNAHDYRAESLAEFFEKVRTENFPINSREKLLREILIKNGILIEEMDGKISAGKGAVISISQESPLYLRTTFIAHEGWHGIYFADEEFRNAVAAIYYTLETQDSETLAYLKRYFQVTPTLNYDVNDTYLMQNEFMAYMLQRPLSATEKYFVDMASRYHSQKWAKKEADYIIETKAAGFVSAATLLDQYVSGRWNLNAGRVWLISR